MLLRDEEILTISIVTLKEIFVLIVAKNALLYSYLLKILNEIPTEKNNFEQLYNAQIYRYLKMYSWHLVNYILKLYPKSSSDPVVLVLL